jgi:hypothetical protein
MNIDAVLQAMNRHGVNYLLIGGMNFMLRHKPLLTYDIDLWIEDTPENREACDKALRGLNAEWGPTPESWGPIAILPQDWLSQQTVYCLTTPHAAVDIMRSVAGLADWHASRRNSILEQTKSGTPYYGLSDADMLQCQMALDAHMRKSERVTILQEIVSNE